MPPDTVKVDRSTRWGNYPAAAAGAKGAEAVAEFARWVERSAPDEWKTAAVQTLHQKNLACWCKEGAPCHADYLLAWVERQARLSRTR